MSAPPANALQGAIQKLAFREPLTAADAEAAFDIVMHGQATAVQVAALLSACGATTTRSRPRRSVRTFRATPRLRWKSSKRRIPTNASRSTSKVQRSPTISRLRAIEHGRTIHGNIGKALRFLLSTNFSEILATLGALAAGAARPMSPIQFLWINLMSDVFPAIALALVPLVAELLQPVMTLRSEIIAS